MWCGGLRPRRGPSGEPAPEFLSPSFRGPGFRGTRASAFRLPSVQLLLLRFGERFVPALSPAAAPFVCSDRRSNTGAMPVRAQVPKTVHCSRWCFGFRVAAGCQLSGCLPSGCCFCPLESGSYPPRPAPLRLSFAQIGRLTPELCPCAHRYRKP